MQVGVVADDVLRSFAIARIMHGEFGIKDAIAVVDALGVESEKREHGLGQSLMEGLVEMARQRGASSVQSQVSWKNEDLLRFFKASHFELSPRLALERPMTELREDEEEVS